MQARETGCLEQIQFGRAEDDDETWEDLLDAESDIWMRNPQVSEVVEELLGGVLDGGGAPATAAEQQQQPGQQRDTP